MSYKLTRKVAKLTRKVATRSLKRRCEYCDTRFLKGDVYYLHRYVYGYYGEIIAYEYLECAKCKYKRNDWKRRHDKFKEKCNHPKEFIEEIWGYIPGEAVKQPEYRLCTLCGKTISEVIM